MKRKNDDEMVQTAVRLPQGLRDRLSKAGGDRGLGEEIRRRLEASFEAEKAPVDAKTRELLDAISSFAERIDVDFGGWPKDAFAYEVLKESVNLLLRRFQPEGKPVPNIKPNSLAARLYDPEHLPTPAEAARLYVHSRIVSAAELVGQEKRK